jgi:hypothetical protein
VRDDGVGPGLGATAPGEHGFGLTGLRDRAALVGGSFAIEAGEGGGTVLRVAVPRTRDDDAAIDAGADAVIGSRYVPGGSTVDWPVHRRLLSRWGNRYTSFVLRLQIRDCTSGFRAYRADALRAISPSTTTAEGYAFLTELVRRLVRGGFKVMEAPIVFADRQRGTSKMSGPIIFESMLLVTRWGVRDLVRRR